MRIDGLKNQSVNWSTHCFLLCFGAPERAPSTQNFLFAQWSGWCTFHLLVWRDCFWLHFVWEFVFTLVVHLLLPHLFSALVVAVYSCIYFIPGISGHCHRLLVTYFWLPHFLFSTSGHYPRWPGVLNRVVFAETTWKPGSVRVSIVKFTISHVHSQFNDWHMTNTRWLTGWHNTVDQSECLTWAAAGRC